MDIHFTARRFKAHRELRNYALDTLRRLDKFYDGILRSDVILSYERKPNSLKRAEINLHIIGGTLSAKETTDDFAVSIDQAIEKLMRQLGRVKSRTKKDKRTIRKFKESLALPASEEE
jgi:ribosomal subunit interface protein